MTRKNDYKPPEGFTATAEDVIRLLKMLRNRLMLQSSAARDPHHVKDLQEDEDACTWHINYVQARINEMKNLQTSSGAAMANDSANIGKFDGEKCSRLANELQACSPVEFETIKLAVTIGSILGDDIARQDLL